MPCICQADDLGFRLPDLRATLYDVQTCPTCDGEGTIGPDCEADTYCPDCDGDGDRCTVVTLRIRREWGPCQRCGEGYDFTPHFEVRTSESDAVWSFPTESAEYEFIDETYPNAEPDNDGGY